MARRSPLARDPKLAFGDLDKYDRRADDEGVLEGRLGEAFFAGHRLLTEVPDFGGAVAALNDSARTLRLGGKAEPAPDVSIIVPIYGQLAYTLNCLDSLLQYKSRYSAEIIIIDDVSPDASAEFLPDVRGIRYHRQSVNGGFIMSCNTGGEMARGRFIVMLNNDTRVVAGWLDELICSFELFPKAGLIGSKMLYADGLLQEAGGIIWRDGTAWNYGRDDDPNRPQYTYARQVDYISGCSIAVPAELWRELAGFDPHYRPAYCEDGDLALRIVMRGLEVWFQPRSRIVHYEGKTSGTDTASGAKAYQVVNSRKSFRRWRALLEVHRPNGQNPYFERERGATRRALVIDATTPTPEQDAGSVTTRLVLELFLKMGRKTHFVPEDNFPFLPKHTADPQRIGIECAYAPYDLGLEAYLHQYGYLFDVIQAFCAPVLEKVLPLLRAHARQAPILFNNMDLHYLRLEREAAQTGDAAKLAAAQAMKQREIAIMHECDCVITPSTYEKTVLDAEMPGAPMVVLPFMMDFYGTDAGYDGRRDICFLGGYRHTANIDAVLFFVREVFPLIRAKEPEIRFIIAGAHPTDEIKALACADVVVAGLVPDLREVFNTTRVFACPLRVGAGVKGKWAAAMSYGLPIVSTTCGAEGMDLVDREEFLLADEPAAFAAGCLGLYRSRKLWDKFSKAGLYRVQTKHSLAMGQKVMQRAIELAVGHQLGFDA